MNKYIFIILISSKLFSNEVYYLDNNPLLLYKIMNWWSIESQKNNTKPCNKPIKVTSDSLSFIYDKKDKTLNIYLKANFPKKISLINQNKKYTIKNIYVDKDYFKIDPTKQISHIKKFVLKDISNSTYQKIFSFQDDIIVQIEGYVKGLLNYTGEISLYHDGDLLRKCPKIISKDQSTFIKFINKKNDRILSTYKIMY